MRQVIKHRDIRLLNMIRRTDPVIPVINHIKGGGILNMIRRTDPLVSRANMKEARSLRGAGFGFMHQ